MWSEVLSFVLSRIATRFTSLIFDSSLSLSFSFYPNILFDFPFHVAGLGIATNIAHHLHTFFLSRLSYVKFSDVYGIDKRNKMKIIRFHIEIMQMQTWKLTFNLWTQIVCYLYNYHTDLIALFELDDCLWCFPLELRWKIIWKTDTWNLRRNEGLSQCSMICLKHK